MSIKECSCSLNKFYHSKEKRPPHYLNLDYHCMTFHSILFVYSASFILKVSPSIILHFTISLFLLNFEFRRLVRTFRKSRPGFNRLKSANLKTYDILCCDLPNSLNFASLLCHIQYLMRLNN